MVRSSVVGHSGTKSANKGVAPRTSSAIKAQILAAHIAGKSNRRIARELNKSTTTVGRVVNALVQDDVIEKGRQRILELVEKALESYEYALENEVDGRLAAKFLKSLGILDSARMPVGIEAIKEKKPQSPDGSLQLTRDACVREKLRKITEIAFARGKAFGNAMPELEDLDSDYAEVIKGKL